MWVPSGRWTSSDTLVPMSLRSRIGMATLGLLALSAPVYAQQVYESVGERALGMGGAFVAVANDATATHWNPAGLAGAGPGGMTIEWQRFQSGNQDGPQLPGPDRRKTQFGSVGSLPLAVSYGTFQTTSLVAQPADDVVVQSLRVRHYGVTILQSVTEGLVVGGTLKYERGRAVQSSFPGRTAGEALKAGEDVDGPSRSAFDVDLGVMADMQMLRVGFTWRNMLSPSFGAIAIPANTLQRQARLGVALLPTDGLTLAMDLDLDTVDLRDGLRRMVALGGEGRLGRRLALRTGIRWSLEGERRPVGAFGGSLMFREHLWLDGHYAQGRLDEDRELGFAMRAGF